MTPGRQVITFHRRHRTAVLDGSKTVTVRWNEAITPGPALLAFASSRAADAVEGRVLVVERFAADELTAEAVRAPADTDMGEYVQQLRANYYPTMPPDARLDVVVFRVEARGPRR